jgi:hypothetical protein
MLGTDDGLIMLGADDGPDEGAGPVLGAVETVPDGKTLGVPEGAGSPGIGLLPMSFKSKLIRSIKNCKN